MRRAVIVAGVALHAVLDIAQQHDSHAGGAHYGCVALLLQPEPDGVLARLSEAGLFGGVLAVLGGGVGHGNALGDDIQRNRMRYAVVRAEVVAGGVLDFLFDHFRLGYRDGSGAPLGHVQLLVEPVVDGVLAHLGELGERIAIRAALGGGVGRTDARRGYVKRDGVRVAVVRAGVVIGSELYAIVDDGFADDGERVDEIYCIVYSIF